jgi:hypothetical protein
MLISAEWVLQELSAHPAAFRHVQSCILAMPRDASDPKIGDVVTCIDASDAPGFGTGQALVNGHEYRVTDRSTAHVKLEGVIGWWDAVRFRAPLRGTDPLSYLLTAIDRGSWAEVLEARRAFR